MPIPRPVVSLTSVWCACLIAAAVGPARAEPVLADPDTGRWLTAETSSPRFDQRHLRLTLDTPMAAGSPIRATAELTLAAIGSARRRLELDADGLLAQRVSVGRDAVPFQHEDALLVIDLPRAVSPGREVVVQIEYQITNLDADGLGLSLRESPRGPVLWSQGQTDHSRLWFPCLDRPDDRLTSEIRVRAPEVYTVLANGTRTDRSADGDGYSVTTWQMDDANPVYLVSLVVGRFDEERVGTLPNGEPALVYSQRALSDFDRDVLRRTPAMVRFFELLFDEPFAWDRYDQVYLPGVAWSMEQTTIAFMDEELLSTGDLENVLVHEVAHHWFGNLVTCRSWQHLWLNEGLANYAELLWAEERARTDDDDATTPETARRRFTDDWRASLFQAPPGRWPIARPMVTRRYSEPDELFELGDNPYTKGALFLDSVRHRIGDRAFFMALADVLDRFRFDAFETADLRRAFERASGQSLERVFDEYTQRPGYPVISASVSWTDGVATIGVRQLQTIDAHNPAYELLVPVRVRVNGVDRTVHVHTDRREAETAVPLPAAPESWTLDPDRTVFAQIRNDGRPSEGATP